MGGKGGAARGSGGGALRWRGGFPFLVGRSGVRDGAMLEKGLVQVYTGDGKGKTTVTIPVTPWRRS